MASSTSKPAALLETERVTSDTERRWCTADELRRVIRRAQLGEDLRAAVLCRFLAETGLRISEAASGGWGDFFTDPYGNVALRVVGKGTKVRSIQLRPALWRAIQRYRKMKALPDQIGADNSPLFPNRRGEPCTARYLRQVVARAVAQSDIGKSASPHWFRHSNATLALAGGAKLLQVQRDLGHASLTTTQKYLHLVEGLRERSADSLPDLGPDPT